MEGPGGDPGPDSTVHQWFDLLGSNNPQLTACWRVLEDGRSDYILDVVAQISWIKEPGSLEI